jgi:AraC-like DNA-binding protein
MAGMKPISEPQISSTQSHNCITIYVRNDNTAEFRRMAGCLDDLDRALSATALLFVMARVSVDGPGRPDLQSIRDATLAIASLTSRVLAAGQHTAPLAILDPVQLRLYCRTASAYEPVIAFAIGTSTIRIETVSAPTEKTGLAAYTLRRAIEYLDSHIADSISLDELARVVQMSPFHLCRMFKRSTGVAPHQWILRRRIEIAKQLIDEPRHSLTDIAYRLGFSSQAHFTTAFRRRTGTTPKQWRLSNARFSQPCG